jgi:CRP/FNR family transcriptional regulator, cyclic AMP receptor protein
MEGLERLLAQHPFFNGLEPPDIALLSGCASNAVFAAGGYLFHEGDPADSFYLIRTGSVALEVASPASGAVIVQTLHPGDVVGFSWLFPPYRMQFDAHATEQVRAFAFDAVCLRGKCDQDPRLGYEMMKRFSAGILSRLQAARLQILDVYGHARAN